MLRDCIAHVTAAAQKQRRKHTNDWRFEAHQDVDLGRSNSASVPYGGAQETRGFCCRCRMSWVAGCVLDGVGAKDSVSRQARLEEPANCWPPVTA